VSRLDVSSRDVFDRGNVHVVVEGPCEELSDEALVVFDGFRTVRPG
jgi:hypothetical protein